MNKAIIGVVVSILIVAGIGIFIWNNYNNLNNTAIAGNIVLEESNSPPSNEKTFTVSSSHLRFYINGVENPDIKVMQGDKVKIEFSSEEGFHDWVLDEFNAKTERVNPGQVSSVEFVADKKGTFEYYCSVGQHRANGMFGKFIVE
ncbi:cupredoxin domain-containing protein [Candidatus Pacearchaeota archaeon]|nr:cupredoxin domain-containing protein [Candidatus Pacearchaeota archaeon]